MQTSKILSQTTHRLLAQSFRPGSTAPRSASSVGLLLRSQPLVAQRTASAQLGGVRTAVSTAKMSPGENLELLNNHRASRPISPHMTILKPALTWYLSIANRMTGAALSGLLYAYAVAYCGLPLLGFPEALTASSAVDFVSHLPYWLKLAVKVPLAAAFNLHNFNGLRHLAWDNGYCLSIKGVYTSGYIVLGATALATIGLCAL